MKLKNLLFLSVLLSLFSCNNDEEPYIPIERYQQGYIEAYTVTSEIKSFQIVNQIGLEVESAYMLPHFTYESSLELSQEELNHKVKELRDKPFVKDVSLSNDNSLQFILTQLQNKQYQKEWTLLMEELQLSWDKGQVLIVFKVPEDEETKWVEELMELEGVESANRILIYECEILY